jgi:hypothetical protein
MVGLIVLPHALEMRRHKLGLVTATANHIPYRIFSSPLARSAMTTPSAGK